MSNNHKGGKKLRLSNDWQEKAEFLDIIGASAQASVLRFCANELQVEQQEDEGQLLTLKEASEVSGYSIDHLGTQLRKGRIPNSGRKGKPLIRLGDLPSKIVPLSRETARVYDATAEAQKSRGVRGGRRLP